jgi:hypothetical protein
MKNLSMKGEFLTVFRITQMIIGIISKINFQGGFCLMMMSLSTKGRLGIKIIKVKFQKCPQIKFKILEKGNKLLLMKMMKVMIIFKIFYREVKDLKSIWRMLWGQMLGNKFMVHILFQNLTSHHF